MKKNYVAVTGDLIKSREIPNRSEIQVKLHNILNKINLCFRKEIAVKFSVTLGDEFQGLLNSLEKSFDIINEIQRLMYPVKISFGVGYGYISTKISKRTVDMDGECFMKSREALQQAKKSGEEIVYNTSPDADLTINTIISLISAIKSDWKDIHYRRTWLYEKLGTLKKVAKSEKVSKQMISKMFIRS